MASLVNIDFVIKAMMQQNCRYWTLRNSDGELQDKCNDDKATKEENAEKLRECWRSIEGDFVIVRITAYRPQRGGDNRGLQFTYNVKCAKAAATTEAAELAYTGKDAAIYGLLSDLKVQIAEQKKDIEIRELQRKLKDRKSTRLNSSH